MAVAQRAISHRRTAAEAGLGRAIISAPRKAPDTEDRVRVWMVAALFPILLFSAQVPAYINDFTPTYVIAKAWPIITVPFTILCLLRRRMPGTVLVMIMVIYAMVITPIITLISFPVGFVTALIPTSKIGAFFNYFSLFEILILLRPRVSELRTTVIALGLFTFFMMWALWLTVPLEVYVRPNNPSLLFFHDIERGPRIYAPMIFGFSLMFYVTRGFWQNPQLWRILVLAGAFATELIIYKQKLAIACVILVMLSSGAFAYPRHRRLIAALAMVAASLGIFAVASEDSLNAVKTIGGSLETRLISAEYVIDYISQSPWRWLFGSGSLPQHGGLNLGDVFRFKGFFLSDLGWLGIVFEYGVIGTILIMATYATAVMEIRKLAPVGDAWSLSLLDYAMYLVLVQSVYSAVVNPGEIMSYLSLAVYTAIARQPTWRNS